MASTPIHPAFSVGNIETHVKTILTLEDTSYRTWRHVFNVHCGSYGVQGHLTGKAKPSDSNDEEWKRLDYLVLSWIYTTVSADLLPMLINPEATAHTTWTAIENLFLHNKNKNTLNQKNTGVMKPPRFFKIMLGDFKHRLRIPRLFMENFKDILTPVCKLKGPSGNERRVQVSWEKDDVVFSSGWGSFVREHSILGGYFLVFTYKGNSTFEVFVFHYSGCEREVAMKNFGDMMEEEDDFGENQVENEIRRSKTHLNAVYKGKGKIEHSHRVYLSVSESDDDDGPSVDGDDTDDEYKISEDETEASGKQTQKRHFSSRRKVSDEEKEATSAKANAYMMRRNNDGVPMVGIVMQPTHVYKGLYLTIPKEWAMKNMVRADHKVELRVSGSDINWEVGCRWIKAGQCQLRSKWAEFVLDNNLEEGDTCVFQLLFKGIMNGKPRSVFKVRIFRMVADIVPLISKRIKE